MKSRQYFVGQIKSPPVVFLFFQLKFIPGTMSCSCLDCLTTHGFFVLFPRHCESNIPTGKMPISQLRYNLDDTDPSMQKGPGKSHCSFRFRFRYLVATLQRVLHQAPFPTLNRLQKRKKNNRQFKLPYKLCNMDQIDANEIKNKQIDQVYCSTVAWLLSDYSQAYQMQQHRGITIKTRHLN